MSVITSGFGGDSGMLGHLRELAEAEPFNNFRIAVQGMDRHIKVDKKEHLVFTHYGTPKIYDSYRQKWILLNLDQIVEIIL